MTREDLKKKLEESNEKCSGGMVLAHIFLGGLCVLTGGAALTVGKTPVARLIGAGSFMYGMAEIGCGGYSLGKRSTLEGLIKEMPEEKETKNEE